MLTLPCGSARKLRALIHDAIVTIAFFLICSSSAFGQCTDPVPSSPIEDQFDLESSFGSVAIDSSGNFVIAWRQHISGFHSEIRAQRFCRSAASLGSFVPLSGSSGTAHNASIAASRAGHYHMAWLGIGPNVGINNFHLLATESAFEDFESIERVPNPDADQETGGDETPSAGASDAEDNHATVGWANDNANLGLLARIDGNTLDPLRDCSTHCSARVTQWLPCVATRSEDGVFAVVFAYDELPSESDTPLNIALVVFDAEGNPLEQLAQPADPCVNPGVWVNDPSREDPSCEDLTTQVSPAVAFVGDDIVVVWAGPHLAACSSGPDYHVYARRFKFDISADPGERLRDPNPTEGEGRAGMFVVDSDPDAIVFNPLVARPTVAITLATGSNAGRFVVAWNSQNNADSRNEVRAQYFDSAGQPRGTELRVNQSTAATANTNERYLGFSGQHTIAYGADDQVVATWTSLDYDEFFHAEDVVSYTLLPPEYARTSFPACTFCQTNPELCDPCLKGDVNADCSVNTSDIQPFINALLFSNLTCANVVDLCPPDMNNDGMLDALDIQCFTNTLLGLPCAAPTPRITDCNFNGVPDDEDIAAETSTDVNTNGVPDECEADCNGNDTPDDWDIAQATSHDCDEDGVPDECGTDCNSNGISDACDVDPADPDGNTQVSADCNTNGYPDECELDCNTNGVPDDCDIDPTDPDGDEWVSPDCNGNEYPDECDLKLPPPFGSLDCNDNDVPDECDIAECESDPACDDCNVNGVPDGCDIAAEISEDANTNGIPDECEGESLMGGGGGGESSMMGEGGGDDELTSETPMPPDEEAAWEAFYQWSAAQCWGPDCETTGAEQFAAMAAKLEELGLSLGQLSP